MIASIKIFGHIGVNEKGVYLVDVIAQLQNYKNFNAIHVLINSPGGSVTEGRAIKQYLQSLNVPVHTEAIGRCNSIATEIFIIGRQRIIHQGCDFLIHLPSGGIEGTADQMAAYAKEMEATEAEMIEAYLSVLNKKNPNVYSYKQLHKMMKSETRLSAQQAVQMGFATRVFKPIYSHTHTKKMAKNGLLLKLAHFLGLEKVALDVVTQDGVALYIETEAAIPAVGDLVSVVETGEPAPDGEHVLADGTTIVVVGGAITEVRMAPVEEVASLQAKVEEIKKDLTALRAKVESEMELTKVALRSIVSEKFALDIEGDKKGRNVKEPAKKVGVKK